MLQFGVLVICLLIGAFVGRLIAGESPVHYGLGIAMGVCPAFAINEQSWWYLLGIPVFALLLYFRRKSLARVTAA